MKRILLLIAFTLTTVAGFSQVGEYNKLTKNNQSFEEYVSKNGDVLKVGDKLTIGQALDADGFRYISQGQMKVHPTQGGKHVTIHKIKSYGKKGSGYTMWISFKGFGLLPVEIDYENALAANEIINPNGMMTKQQAIDKLKESKELLDLEVISQEEYDKIKAEMIKHIN